VDGAAGVVVPAGVVTDAKLLTASNAATVGVVTVHDEQVPVDDLTVLPMVVVPPGKLADTVTVNGTGTVAPAATVRFWVQVLPAAVSGVQVQPVPLKVVWAGTVSVRVVAPGLPPSLVTAI